MEMSKIYSEGNFFLQGADPSPPNSSKNLNGGLMKTPV